ncbi:MAG: FMN-binding protein [Acidimicrobiales bacterium]
MRRAPIVTVATVAGLAGVLSFHTKSAPLTLGTAARSAATRGSSPTSVAAASPPKSGSNSTGSSSPSTTTPSAKRTATGVAVNYNYGILSVSVTATGKRITKVQIASIDDGGNFRSESIDQQSIPILEQEALQAQSANIQSISGASYTSAGFKQSLQSALTKLGIE